MEEFFKEDDALLEDIKVRLVCCIKVFETSKIPLLPAFSKSFDSSSMGIIADIGAFMDKIESLTITAFGFGWFHRIVLMPDLKRGGQHWCTAICLTL